MLFFEETYAIFLEILKKEKIIEIYLEHNVEEETESDIVNIITSQENEQEKYYTSRSDEMKIL